MVIVLHKPYGVLSQFTSDGSSHRPLADLGLPPRVYPVGRLDADSEGMLLLTSRKGFTSALLEPKRRHTREYWVQVERVPDESSLRQLEAGIVLQGQKTLPCRAWAIPDPGFTERNPPIRYRKSVPTSWLALELMEGRNRQVRKMTAAIGFPTLRLVRVRIGSLWLSGLAPGQWRELSEPEVKGLFQ
ncbi:MAG: pseudouridine synthase [Myxococcota bacterium]